MSNHRSILCSGAVLLCFAVSVHAQNVRVNVSKHTTAIPEVCRSVDRARIESPIDLPALVKEATCKGAGDMMSDYTYVMEFVRREIDKKGQAKLDTTVYEVYSPILKSGTGARGILLMTSRNGKEVTGDELEKERRGKGSIHASSIGK